MKTSSVIVMAGATLLAASVFGPGLVRAFPAAPAQAAATPAPSSSYAWRGYWDAGSVVPAGYAPDCPFRKVWLDTPEGPRLKWRRSCAAD